MSGVDNQNLKPPDLQDASRERLLTEIGYLQHSLTNIPKLESQIAQLQGELAESKMRILNIRDYNIGSAAELGEVKADLIKYQNDLTREQIQLRAIYASRTWKVGRLIMLPIRILRRLLKAN